jgi:DNA-binding transcriptional regulator YdaS (Cro superfamily)
MYFYTMLLGDYLVKYKIDQCDFAKLVGVHASSVGRWLAGERTPSGSHAKKIVEATNRKVTLQDIYA